jgi:hypothetical protein
VVTLLAIGKRKGNDKLYGARFDSTKLVFENHWGVSCRCVIAEGRVMPAFTSRIQAAAGRTSKITNSDRHELESLLCAEIVA